TIFAKMYCTKCKGYRDSRYSSCGGSCGSGNCQHVCASCGEHSLIDYTVQKVGDELGLTKSNPILMQFQERMARVNAGGWRDEFTMRIDEATVDGYRGPTRYVTYNKNKKFQITDNVFVVIDKKKDGKFRCEETIKSSDFQEGKDYIVESKDEYSLLSYELKKRVLNILNTLRNFVGIGINKEQSNDEKANLIIQPVRPSLDDLNPAIREFNSLFKSGIKKDKLSFVINAVNSEAEKKATHDYLAQTDYYICPLSLPDKISYREVQNQGLSIAEVKYKRL
ncbi:4292_t:CDS:2, partial [Ambispora gerdemannii]